MYESWRERFTQKMEGLTEEYRSVADVRRTAHNSENADKSDGHIIRPSLYANQKSQVEVFIFLTSVLQTVEHHEFYWKINYDSRVVFSELLQNKASNF